MSVIAKAYRHRNFFVLNLETKLHSERENHKMTCKTKQACYRNSLPLFVCTSVALMTLYLPFKRSPDVFKPVVQVLRHAGSSSDYLTIKNSEQNCTTQGFTLTGVTMSTMQSMCFMWLIRTEYVYMQKSRK